MKMEEKIFDYIKSNQEHSTLVGRVITIKNNDLDDDDDDKIKEFSQWMASFVRKAEKFARAGK